MKRIGTIIIAGLFTAATLIPTAALAGRGGHAAAGQGSQVRQGNQVRQHSMDQTRTRLHDGSGKQGSQAGNGEAQKRGNIYGPGDGTGNRGDRPQDGTGYGAPSK